MGAGLKALILPYKAPVITDPNKTGDSMILSHKATAGFNGGKHHIAPRYTL